MRERVRVQRKAVEPSHAVEPSAAPAAPDAAPHAPAAGPMVPTTSGGHLFGEFALVAAAQARLSAAQPDSNQPLHEDGFNPMDITHQLVRAIDQSQVIPVILKRHVDFEAAAAALANLTPPQTEVVRAMYAVRAHRSLEDDLFEKGESGYPSDLKADQRKRLAALLGGTKVSIGAEVSAGENARAAAAAELHELLHGDLDKRSVDRIMSMLRQGADENSALDAAYTKLYEVSLRDQLGALGPGHVMRALNLFMGRNAEADRIDVGGKRARVVEIDAEVAELREEASGFFGNPVAPIVIEDLQKERKRLVSEMEQALQASVDESRSAVEHLLPSEPTATGPTGEARAAAVDEAGRARAAAVLGGDIAGTAAVVGGVDAEIVRTIATVDPVGKAAAELRKAAASDTISAAQISAAIRGLRQQADARAKLENPGAGESELAAKADAIAADYFARFRGAYDSLGGEGSDFDALIKDTGSAADAAANTTLMEGRGRLLDVQEIVIALAGNRKDTEAVERVLKNKTALEIKLLKTEYFVHTGGRSLDYDLFGEAPTTAGQENPEMPMLGQPLKPQGKARGTSRLSLEDYMQKPEQMGGLEEAEFLAARAEREYEYTIDNRGATGAWRDTFGNEERDLLDETIAEVRKLEQRYKAEAKGDPEFAPSQQARRILEQMRLARATIRGDREAYEKATAELRATFEAVASFALQAALTAVIGPLSQALLASRLAQSTSFVLRVALKGAQTAAVGTASTIGANLAVYGSDYSLEMLKADIKGGFGSALGPLAIDALAVPFARGLVGRLGSRVNVQILALSKGPVGKQLVSAGVIFGEEALEVARTAAGMKTGAWAQGRELDLSFEAVFQEYAVGKAGDVITHGVTSQVYGESTSAPHASSEPDRTPEGPPADQVPAAPVTPSATNEPVPALAAPKPATDAAPAGQLRAPAGAGGGSPDGDTTAVYRRPGAVSQAPDPHSEVEAWRLYQAHRTADPSREVALVFNHRVKEWAVVQGDANSVANNAEMLGWSAEDTQVARHSHPVGRGGQTSEANQLASGRGGDVDVVAADVVKGEGPASNWHAIDIVLADGKSDRTWVVYSAETGQWTVDFPDPSERGGRGSISFESVDTYHEWFSQRFGISADVSGRAGAGAAPGLNAPDILQTRYATELADPKNDDLKKRLDAADLLTDKKQQKEQRAAVHQDLVARLRGVTSEHVKNLGDDPAQGAYRANEAETALNVEEQAGVRLERYRPKNSSEKGDWVDEKNVVYDGCSPAGTQFFDRQVDSYKQQLIDHLKHPTVNKVVIDVSGLDLTEPQVKKLETIIADALRATGKIEQDLVRIR
jgi:hypothetical protein